MTYVGAVPTTGDFKKLDSITTSSATTFNLRQGGVAVYPQSANHCIVSLNGVIQAPVDAFTIVNDTIVFASSLASSDVINFILVLGNINDIGTPSDDTVSQAKIQNEAINEAKMQISNAGTNGQFLSKQSGNTGGLTWADAGGDLSFGGDTFGADKTIGSNDAYALSFETNNAVGLKIDNAGHVTKPLQSAFLVKTSAMSNLATATTHDVKFDSEIFDQNADFDTSTYTFTAPVTGRYQLSCDLKINNIDKDSDYYSGQIECSNRSIGIFNVKTPYLFSEDTNYHRWVSSCLIDMDANDTAKVTFRPQAGTAQADINANESLFSGFLAC